MKTLIAFIVIYLTLFGYSSTFADSWSKSHKEDKGTECRYCFKDWALRELPFLHD